MQSKKEHSSTGKAARTTAALTGGGTSPGKVERPRGWKRECAKTDCHTGGLIVERELPSASGQKVCLPKSTLRWKEFAKQQSWEMPQDIHNHVRCMDFF